MGTRATTAQNLARIQQISLIVTILIVPGTLVAQEESLRDDGSVVTHLDELVAEAVTDYPAILAEWAEVDGLRAREEQVSQPFDPTVTIGLLNLPVDSFAFNQHAMTGLMFSAREQFYWPGVLNARADEARAIAEAREAAVPETVVRIWLSAVSPYYTIVDLVRAERVLHERRTVLGALLDAARARYEARAVPLSDVLRVQTQLSRVDQDLAAVARSRSIAIADLNGLLNRPTTESVVVHPAGDPIRPDGDPEGWLDRSIENRPAFAALDAQQHMVDAQRRAAEANDDPIWSIGMAYALRFQPDPVGTDLFTLNLGISLPFFSSRRTDARLDELSARSTEIGFDRSELERQLRAQIGIHFEAMNSLEAEIALLDEELIPSVESTYESALAHYASSHISIEILIEIQDRLLELDLARSRLVSMHDMNRARLRALAVDSETILSIVWSQQ